MTAAGSGIILMSSELFAGEHKTIKDRLLRIDPNMPRAIDDFMNFMNKGSGINEEEIPAQIGLWVLWNIKQKEPTYDETKKISPLLGNFLIQTVSHNRNKPNN
jgi:hypothetical protein